MKNRQVSIGVCGIVAGMIAVAGILSLDNGVQWSGDITEVAAVYTVPRNIENASPRYIKKHNVKPAPADVRKEYPTLIRDITGPVNPDSETQTEPTEPVVTDFTACESAKDIADRLIGDAKKDAPRVLRNEQAQTALKYVFEDIVAEYCPEEAAAAASASSSSVKPVNNRCKSRFIGGSARYVTCVREGEMGKSY